MSDLDSNYCEVCGEAVESAHAIRADSDDPFPPGATGEFGTWPSDIPHRERNDENAVAHAQISEREVRVYVHQDGDGQ